MTNKGAEALVNAIEINEKYLADKILSDTNSKKQSGTLKSKKIHPMDSEN
jgi:hypothetical protein